jgi:hypothetical protein
MIHSIYN